MAVGIDNIKKVVLLVISFGKQIDTAAKDGFKFNDILGFLPELTQIPDIIKDKDAIVSEFKDLTKDELASLVAYVETNLALTNVKTEALISAALEVAVSILGLVEALKMPKAA